jgi:hypothetical protein
MLSTRIMCELLLLLQPDVLAAALQDGKLCLLFP